MLKLFCFSEKNIAFIMRINKCFTQKKYRPLFTIILDLNTFRTYKIHVLYKQK